jgi:hypothetical protein
MIDYSAAQELHDGVRQAKRQTYRGKHTALA